jgi:glycosyltransferase involved in cell wall biosynthesis
MATTLGLKNGVTFLGNRKDPEVFYAGIDVLALTSRNEGTPLTLIEAMANARPVIATSVGGVVDLLGPEISREDGYTICERGISVPDGDTEAFARGLQRLITDGELRTKLGRAGLEFVKQNYGKDRLLRDISQLYADIKPIDQPRLKSTSAAE